MYNLDFEWDIKKFESNIRKHGVSFNEAATVFKDKFIKSIYDEKHSDVEDRWISLGVSEKGRVLIVCHTYLEVDNSRTIIRIFSARKSTRIELKQYRG